MNSLIINSISHSYEIAIYLDKRNNYVLKQNDLPFSVKDDIVNLLSELLNKYKLNFNNLDIIGVIVGPGSYTSLRVGVALANSLGFALNIPIIGISVFKVLIETAKKLISYPIYRNTSYTILSIIPDYKGGFFGQLFDNKFQKLTEPMVIDQDSINFYKSAFVISNNIELVKNILNFDENTIIFSSEINSENIKNAVEYLYNNSNVENNKPLDVLYIKSPKITLCKINN